MGNKTCMVLRYGQITLRTAAVAILLLLVKPAVKQVECDAPKSEVQTFFYTLDRNHDGQLEQSEVERYVGASVGGTDFQTQQQLDKAAHEVIGRLDGGDVGTTISEAELERHLHTILQGTKVSDWVIHGLGLPMYAAAFEQHSICALDFPLLVNDGGLLLEQELGLWVQGR